MSEHEEEGEGKSKTDGVEDDEHGCACYDAGDDEYDEEDGVQER